MMHGTLLSKRCYLETLTLKFLQFGFDLDKVHPGGCVLIVSLCVCSFKSIPDIHQTILSAFG